MPKNSETATKTCKKCNGLGVILMFAHNEGGRCFACNDPRTAADKAHNAAVHAEARRLNAMTPEERDAYITAKSAEIMAKQKAARSERRAARAAAKAGA